MEGKQRADMRTARNKFSRLNYRFEVLEHGTVTNVLPRLREISDLWLAKKNATEKRFSLGFFDESYVCRTRVAVARNEEGKIMAFANIWETDRKNGLSIDMMRYDPESPGGIMDFLFAELMLWAKEDGFSWFTMGVAPLSGLERHPLAPMWHKIGTTIFDLGEEFYNFEGLYEYKAKFGPEWQPRYLATPAGLSAPLVMVAVTRLIAGGWKSVFSH